MVCSLDTRFGFGSSAAAPQAQLLPSELDFGFVYTGSDTPGTLSLTNHGGSELSIASIVLVQAGEEPEHDGNRHAGIRSSRSLHIRRVYHPCIIARLGPVASQSRRAPPNSIGRTRRRASRAHCGRTP